MTKEIRTIALGAVVLTVSLAAYAQTAAPVYNSAFQGYRPFTTKEVGDWRKANDTVREIGGWRAYAREIHGATPARPAASGPSAAPSRPPNPHQGHQR